MPLQRIPQRDVGEGPANQLPSISAAAAPGLAAAQAAKEAQSALLDTAGKIQGRQEALLYAEESSEAQVVYDESTDVIESELERGVREQGWSLEETVKQKKRMTDEVLGPRMKSFRSPMVKRRFGGLVEGFRSVGVEDLHARFTDLANQDALHDLSTQFQDRVLDLAPLGTEVILDILSDAEEALAGLEEIAPKTATREEFNTDHVRAQLISTVLSAYREQHGPALGELLFHADVLHGKMDTIPKRITTSIKAEGPRAIDRLARGLAVSTMGVQGGAPSDFAQVPGMTPRALPRRSGVDSALEALDGLPPKPEILSARQALLKVQNDQIGWEFWNNRATEVNDRLLLSFQDGTPYKGPGYNMVDDVPIAAMDNLQREGLFPAMLDEDPSGERIRQYYVGFARNFGLLTPFMSEFASTLANSAQTNPNVLIAIAQARDEMKPEPFGATKRDRSGSISVEEFDESTDRFFDYLSGLHAKGDNPVESVRLARHLSANEELARAQEKIPPVEGATPQQKLARKQFDKDKTVLREFIEDALPGRNVALSDQMVAQYRIELLAARLDVQASADGSMPSGPLDKIARLRAGRALMRRHPPVSIAGQTHFSQDLRKLVDETPWTEQGLTDHAIDFLVQAGFTKKQVDDLAENNRLMFTPVPNQEPGKASQFHVWVVPEDDDSVLEPGQAGVVGRDATGIGDILELDYKRSFEHLVRATLGQEGMISFAEDSDELQESDPERHEQIAASIGALWVDSDLVASRPFLGFDPDAGHREMILDAMRDGLTDEEAEDLRVVLSRPRVLGPKGASPFGTRQKASILSMYPDTIERLKFASRMLVDPNRQRWRESEKLREEADRQALEAVAPIIGIDPDSVKMLADPERDRDLAKIAAIEVALGGQSIDKDVLFEQEPKLRARWEKVYREEKEEMRTKVAFEFGGIRFFSKVGPGSVELEKRASARADDAIQADLFRQELFRIDRSLAKKWDEEFDFKTDDLQPKIWEWRGLKVWSKLPDPVGVGKKAEKFADRSIREILSARQERLRESLSLPAFTQGEPLISTDRLLDLLQGADPTDAVVGKRQYPNPGGGGPPLMVPVTERDLAEIIRNVQRLTVQQMLDREFKGWTNKQKLVEYFRGGNLPDERKTGDSTPN